MDNSDSGVAAGVSFTIVGDVMGHFLAGARRLAASAREFDEANIGVTADEIVEGFADKCPEIREMTVVETLARTLEMASRGYRGWEAVHAAAPSRHVTNPGVRSAPGAVAVVRRTPPGRRPARSHSRRQSASRGSPGRQDDEPELLPAPAAGRYGLTCCACGEAFAATRPHARTCSSRCRKRLERESSRATEPDLVENFRDFCRRAATLGVISPEEALIDAILLPDEKLLRMREAVAS
jgi:hypothetical protein